MHLAHSELYIIMANVKALVYFDLHLKTRIVGL